MIVFRVLGNGLVEWSADSGGTWYGQEAVMPPPVLRSWWALMVAVGMRELSR